MRKFAMVAALAVMGAAFAEAQERSIHALGLTVPVWNQTWTLADSDIDEYGTSMVGVNVMYHHLKVSDSHFSSFTDVELGYASLSIDEMVMDGHSASVSGDGTELDGFNTRFMFGLGGAPLVNDLVTLAVHGTFGVNLLYAAWSGSHTYEDTYWNGYRWVTKTYSVDASNWGFDLWTTIGLNVEAAFCFTEHFGVFAGLNLYTNLFGFGLFGTEMSYDGYSDNDSDAFLTNFGDFNVDFRIGVAFTY